MTIDGLGGARTDDRIHGEWELHEDIAVVERELRSQIEQAEEYGEHALSSLAEHFGRRRLALHTMSPPLRLATRIGIGVLVGTMVLLVLRDVGHTSVFLGPAGGGVVSISTPIFVSVLVLLSIGFGYIFTAATLAGAEIALPVVAALVVLIGLYTGAFHGLVNWFSVPGVASWEPAATRAILAAILALAVSTKLWDWHGGRHSRRRRPVRTLLVAYSALAGAYLFLIWAASPTVGSLNLYGVVISLVVADFAFLVYPVLQVAAVDFGEWGQIVAERATSTLGNRRTWPIWALGALGAAAITVTGALQLTGQRGGSGEALRAALRDTGLVAAVLAVVVGIILVAGLHHHPVGGLNFAALVAVLALTAVVIPPLALSLSGGFAHLGPASLTTPAGTYAPGADVVSVHQSSGGTAYSFQVPRGWLVTRSPTCDQGAGTDCVTAGLVTDVSNSELGTVAILPSSAVSITGAVQHLGQWQFSEDDEPTATALDFLSPVRGTTPPMSYLLTETVQGSFVFAKARPLFYAIASSFRGSGQSPAPLPPPAADEAYSASQQAKHWTTEVALELGLALALLAGLMLRARRWRVQLVAAIVLLAVLGAFDLARLLGAIGSYALGPHTHLPSLDRHGMVFAFGLLGLVAIVAVRTGGWHASTRGRTLVATVLGLEGAVAALVLMDYLYSRALSAERVSVWAGIVLLVAAGWDLTMSGESLTNRDTPRVPRAARVLGFLGYLILLGAAVLFYSAERFVANGHLVQVGFEPESITRDALFSVALPVLLLTFLVRLLQRRPVAAPSDS